MSVVDAMGVVLTARRRRAILEADADPQLSRRETSALDRLAWGFTAGTRRRVALDRIVPVDASNLATARVEVARRPTAWVRWMEVPVGLDLVSGGRLFLADGYHRYVTAERLGIAELPARIEISTNPIPEIHRLAEALRDASGVEAMTAPRGLHDVSRHPGHRDTSRRAGDELAPELRRLVASMPEAARAWVLAHPEEANARYAATVGAGSLHGRFGATGAPRPGERGYKPAAGRSPGRGMLARAYANLEDPMFYAGWSALTEEHEWSDEEEHEELVTDFLDLYVGVPDHATDGRPYTFEDRAYLALWITDLAMLAHPDMHHNTTWTGGEVYMDHRPEGEPLPYWLAAALAEDAFQLDRGLRLVNVPVEQACTFIAEHHSHLPTCNRRGLMYALGVRSGRRLVAVATAGHPTGRWGKGRVDPRDVLELTRVASDATVKGAASKLVARLLDLLPHSGRGSGPQLFVTYSLVGEPGVPYKALADKGLRPVERIPGKVAGGARKGSHDALHHADKVRWEAGALAAPARWELVG